METSVKTSPKSALTIESLKNIKMKAAEIKMVESLLNAAKLLPGAKEPSIEEALSILGLKESYNAANAEYQETHKAEMCLEVIRARLSADTELLKAIKALMKYEGKTGMSVKFNLNAAYQIEVHNSARDLYATKMQNACEPGKLISMKAPVGTIIDEILQGE